MEAEAQTDLLYLYIDSTTFVSARHNSMLKSSSEGVIDVDVNMIKALPKLLGNNDPIRFVRLLPAVQTNSECDSGIHIQGCDNAHNDISLGGIPVYGVNHLLGLFSVFNPSHYGRMVYSESSSSNRLGGMVMMSLPDTLTKRVTGEVDASLMSSQGSLGFRLGDKTHIRLSARGSYLNLLYDSWLKMLDSDLHYRFGDYNFTSLFTPTDKDRIWLDLYYGNDKAALVENTFNMNLSVDWGNLAGGIHWEHKGDDLYHRHTAFYSGYVSNVDVEQDDAVAQLPSRIMSFGYKGDFRWNGLKSEAETVLYDVMPQSPHVEGVLNLGKDPVPLQKGIEASISIGYSGSVTDRLSLESSVKGTLFANPDTRPYWGLLPDIALSYDMFRFGKLRAAYGWRRQHIFQTGLSNIGLPVEFWILSGRYGRPQSSQYVDLSYETELLNGALSLTAGAFGKILYDQIEYKGDLLDLLLSKYDLNENLLRGKGWNYGLNLMLHKQSGKFTGWINYSLGRAVRRFDNPEYQGLYPANHERIHDLNVVGSYQSGRWGYSGTFVYASGLPFTAPRSFYISSGQIVAEYGEHNACRMRPYIRLDLSINCCFIKNERQENGVNFSIYNVLGRKNDIMYKLFVEEEGFYFSNGSIPLVFMPSFSYYHKF